MGSWRSAPVVALVSLCVVDLAEAAPQPPAPQPVNVVNTSVPVTVQNPDLDVVVTNIPDVSITNTPNVNIANTPAVTIADMPEVTVSDERFQWSTIVSQELDPDSGEETWCTQGMTFGGMEPVPAGYRFDVTTVNGQVFIPEGHQTQLRLAVLYDSYDFGRVHDIYLPSHLLTAFGRDYWTTHEAVPVRDATAVCVTLQYETFAGLGNGFIFLSVIGYLTPE